MRLTRYLKPAQIKLELATKNLPELPEGWTQNRYVQDRKESILFELADLLETSGKVANKKKFLIDLINREKKATTGIGGGIAIPHVRTMQVRDFTMAFARSAGGVEFGALDKQPVHLFFAIVAPPYDDTIYLKLYRQIGLIFGQRDNFQKLIEAKDEHEVIKILGAFDEE